MMERRTVRLPAHLWEAIERLALARREPVSVVLVRLLVAGLEVVR
jgi:hypothetical protein